MAESKTLPAGVPPENLHRHNPDADRLTPAPFGTPRPADANGELPRIVNPLDRATPGTTRYKIRCDNFNPPARRNLYILAKEGDEAGACACYMRAEGLDKEITRLQKIKKSDDVEEPQLVVTVLPD